MVRSSQQPLMLPVEMEQGDGSVSASWTRSASTSSRCFGVLLAACGVLAVALSGVKLAEAEEMEEMAVDVVTGMARRALRQDMEFHDALKMLADDFRDMGGEARKFLNDSVLEMNVNGTQEMIGNLDGRVRRHAVHTSAINDGMIRNDSMIWMLANLVRAVVHAPEMDDTEWVVAVRNHWSEASRAANSLAQIDAIGTNLKDLFEKVADAMEPTTSTTTPTTTTSTTTTSRTVSVSEWDGIMLW